VRSCVIFGTVLSEVTNLGTHFRRHEDPAPSDPVIEISEQDFESISRRNVERWVSAHIIPVRHSHPRSHILYLYILIILRVTTAMPNNTGFQTYNTLLCGKSVTFKSIDGSDQSAPEWRRVAFEDGARIVGMKEVCVLLPFCPYTSSSSGFRSI